MSRFAAVVCALALLATRVQAQIIKGLSSGGRHISFGHPIWRLREGIREG
jgi:hypothetical protein